MGNQTARIFLLVILILFTQMVEAQTITPGLIDSLKKTDTAALRVDRQQVNNEIKTIPVNNAPASTSDAKTVFGSQLFTTASLSFEPNLRIATPPDYILGPDDELQLNIYGYQEASYKLQVLPEGSIYIPQVGMIAVSGLTVEAATKRIQQKLSSTAYGTLKSGTSKLGITLSKIKSIRVTILGANKPGTYTISSLSSLFNALYLCGGPDNAVGSYREIQLLRNNKVISTIDLYDFLMKGNLANNILLKENDVIHIPTYKKRVSIIGEVRRQGIFEMKDGETIDQLLYYASGFTDKAYTSSIKIKQITDKARSVKDLSKDQYNLYVLMKGDEITVDTVLERFDNSVTINGAVFRPGQFELTKDLTLSSLIKKADGLTPDVYKGRGVINRVKEDGTKEIISFNVTNVVNGGAADIVLQKADTINISSINDFKDVYQVSIAGEVRKPGNFPYQEKITFKDLLFLAGGFTQAATLNKIELARRIKKSDNGLEADTISIVKEIITDKDLTVGGEPFYLEPNDQITVRKQPGYEEQYSVTINGEVLYPGSYTVQSKKERISDLLKRSGGFTRTAFAGGVSLIRIDKTSASLVKQKLNIVSEIQQNIKDTASNALQEVANPLSKIAIDINQVLNAPGSKEDLFLEKDDIIEVPRAETLVKISGQVYAPTKVNYYDGRSLTYYVDAAGGKSDNAKLSRAYIIYPNGKVSRTNHYIFGLFRDYPTVKEGAEIIVPKKAPKKTGGFAEVMSITTGLLSLISLTVVTLSALK